MAETTTVQMRIMLQRYEQQLLSARRLARFRVRTRLDEGLDPHDPDPGAKRNAYVERAAQELYDTLIFTGSVNPVVEEIRQELGELVGREVRFTYPPGGRLRIVGVGPDGPFALPDEEERHIRYALWRITRNKVNSGMQDQSAAERRPGTTEAGQV